MGGLAAYADCHVTQVIANPEVFIIAGPNGAGKTTFAREFLPQEAKCKVFINADLIAAGLSPFSPETAALQAGRLMLAQIEHHFQKRESFAVETTFAGRAYLQAITRWKEAGYHVTIIFLKLSSVQEAVARVRQRVLQGGHDIPDDVIARRFEPGFRHFEDLYKAKADAWALYDNSGIEPVLLNWGEK